MRILLDVTRTLVHSKKSTPTGIDRVEHAYIRYLLAHRTTQDVFFLANTPYGRGVLPADDMADLFAGIERTHQERARLAPGDTFAELLRVLSEPLPTKRSSPLSLNKSEAPVSDSVWSVAKAFIKGRQRFNALMRDGMPSVYLHVSHLQLDEPRCFTWLEASNILPVFFVHDLIPIEFPEFCSPHAAERHQRRIETIMRYGKGILLNSSFTLASLQHYAEGRQLAPHRVVPLANTIGTDDKPIVPDLGATLPFFVHVGTIEGRKNISHLLTVWRALIERLGPQKAPRLVLVGRRGWECETVTSTLDRSRDLANHVIEVSGLRDSELHALMRSSSGLITVSVTEGFGLPPVEAARLGVPVIASDIPAHREVLGDAATFVGIHDGEGLLQAVQMTMSMQRSPTASLLPEFSWDEHVALALRSIEDMAGH